MLQFFYTTVHSTAYALALIEAHRQKVSHPRDFVFVIRVNDEPPTAPILTSKLIMEDTYARLIFYPYRVDERGTCKVNSLLKEIQPWLDVEKLEKLPKHVKLTVLGAHRLAPVQVDELRYIADLDANPILKEKQAKYQVTCYGLRTGIETTLFPGARKLMELADTIECITMNCSCGRPATFNYSTESLGEPLCSVCYYKRILEETENDETAPISPFVLVARKDAEEYAERIKHERNAAGQT